jgi:hypothetical protein
MHTLFYNVFVALSRRVDENAPISSKKRLKIIKLSAESLTVGVQRVAIIGKVCYTQPS